MPAQLCQWRGIPREKINGSCTRPATLTGQSNGTGQQHLCTQHMRLRVKLCYGYQFVWACVANNRSYYLYKSAKQLSKSARQLCH